MARTKEPNNALSADADRGDTDRPGDRIVQVSDQKYYIGWRSLLTGAEGGGSVALPKEEAERLIEAANKRFTGQVEHFLVPAVTSRAERQIAIGDMITFMVSLPPDENITQAVIRGAMRRFNVREGVANRAYSAAIESGGIQQAITVRPAPTYHGNARGYFRMPTGYYYWELVK